MRKRLLTILVCVLAISLSAFAAGKKKKAPAPTAPDKKYLQKILDGWSSLNAADMAQYYDQGEYLFFDVTPLKYNNWAEYQKGVAELGRSIERPCPERSSYFGHRTEVVHRG